MDYIQFSFLLSSFSFLFVDLFGFANGGFLPIFSFHHFCVTVFLLIY